MIAVIALSIGAIAGVLKVIYDRRKGKKQRNSHE